MADRMENYSKAIEAGDTGLYWGNRYAWDKKHGMKHKHYRSIRKTPKSDRLTYKKYKSNEVSATEYMPGYCDMTREDDER